MESKNTESAGGSPDSFGYGESQPDWAEEACEAERKQDWKKAQLLWERALLQAVPHEINRSGDKEYGTGLVILSHLHDIAKEHLGFHAIDTMDRIMSEKKYSPVGHWKKLQSYQEAQSAYLTSGGSILVRVLLALFLGTVFFLFSYPFSNAAANILLVGGIALILAVAILIGSLTNFWGGLIAFFVTAYLLDFLCDGVSEWLELGDGDLALLYLLRAVGVLAGVVLLCSAVVSMSGNHKKRGLRAESRKGAVSLRQHARACHNAAVNVIIMYNGEDIPPEVKAIRFKYLYQSADRWHFQRVKGSVKEDGWGDANEMWDEVYAMGDYYTDMYEMAYKLAAVEQAE